MTKVSVKDIIGISDRDPLMPFYADNPLSLLVEVMARGQQRVALFGSDRQLFQTCSQTDVVMAISELCDKHSALKHFATKTLQELGIGHSPVPFVTVKSSVQSALEKLFLKITWRWWTVVGNWLAISRLPI